MIKGIAYFAAILWLIIGCTSKSELEVGYGKDGLVLFKGTLQPIKLKSKKKELADFRLPIRIKLIDNYLFVTDLKRNDGMVGIYDLNNDRFLKSIIPKGNGPFELSAISSIINGNSGNIYFYDVQSLRLLEAKLDFLVGNSSAQPSYVKRIISDKYEKVLRIANLSDTSFMAYTLPGIGGRFSTLNSKFDFTGFQFGDYPPIEKKAEIYEMTEVSFYSKVLGNLYTCSIEVLQSKNLLVIAHHNVDVIEVYDYHKLKLLLRIVGPDQNLPPKYIINKSGQALPCLECKCGYSSPQVSPAYIALLRLHKLYSNEDSYISKYIYFFDWQGALVKIFELDAEVTEFVIDNNRHKIYAIAFDQDKALLEYDLPIE